MNVGQLVHVPVYGGRIVERVVVQVIENKIVVSTLKEYEDSIAEERPALGVGYELTKVCAS